MSLNFDEMTKEELINYIKKLKREHKYGLVWEEKQEDLDELLKDNYPILENVSPKDILDYDGQPNLFIEGENLHALELLYITHKLTFRTLPTKIGRIFCVHRRMNP
ncbi:hypothetical protein [Geobacillus thermoleovorans]|uniref:hypothetical protein n=1 Tax=Geobacillus thermoleovorans TaxID=33941 RepID=UPI003D1C1F0C